MLIYVIRSGNLYDGDTHLGCGYSGHGVALNDPMYASMIGVGPIPVGTYTMGPPHTPEDHLGPVALPLYADKANNMFGRCGFFCHGDNSKMNFTASNGCVIMALVIRTAMNARKDRMLRVIAEEWTR
jgi:hypothetical protein